MPVICFGDNRPNKPAVALHRLPHRTRAVYYNLLAHAGRGQHGAEELSFGVFRIPDTYPGLRKIKKKLGANGAILG